MDLEGHLRACMPEAMSARPSRAARTAFHVELKADPDLAAEAKARLAGIDQGMTERDHISRVLKTLLEEALNG